MITDTYEKIMKLAESAGLSVTALCRRADVAPSTVTRWRSGKTQPTFRIWRKLEEAAQNAEKKTD